MNINEIAELAGVSRATVSRYLNQGYVSEDKKNRIRKVIEETGYKPSTQAQTLRNRKTKLIGVILPKINSYSISRMVAGISEVLSQTGYQLILGNTDNNEKEELNYLKVFSNYQVEGIILIATIFTREHQKVMKELGIPIVVLGQNLEGYTCVYQDDYKAAFEMASYLLQNRISVKYHEGDGVTQKEEKPSSNFAYISVTPKDKAVGTARSQGVKDAFTKQLGSWKECVITESGFTIEAGYQTTKELFEKKQELDTILCATDQIALGAIKYLHEIGIQVPEVVQVAGLGDTSMSSVITPSLTTMRFPYRESGVEAARLLVEKINEPTSIRKEIKMGYQMIYRESTRN